MTGMQEHMIPMFSSRILVGISQLLPYLLGWAKYPTMNWGMVSHPVSSDPRA